MAQSARTIGSALLCGMLLAAGLCAAPAQAQDSRSAEQRACGHDVSRHCRRVINDGDMAIFGCLQQNRERLSAACRRVVDSH
jgi:hypothetical protein